jgi:hypothetical protein
MIELYVHSNNGVDPVLVQAEQDATITEILEKIAGNGGFGGKVEDDILVFAEDCEEPFERQLKLSECEIRHRHHIHCHRCRKVLVTVYYNGVHKETFPPGTKVKRVLKWAIHAFKLSPTDAAEKILVLKEASNQELPLDAHIGSFTHPHQCSVELCLTAPVEVQG